MVLGSSCGQSGDLRKPADAPLQTRRSVAQSERWIKMQDFSTAAMPGPALLEGAIEEEYYMVARQAEPNVRTLDCGD